ncbi:MAG: prenyltransferase/squalene oxidase repeat-containing protein [Bacillota bacterium]
MKPVTRFLVAVILMIGPAIALAQPANPAAKGQAVVDKAIAFLRSTQKPDGSWQTERTPPAITAIALKAIVQNPKYDAKTDFVKKGYDKLLGYQWADGGIYKDMLANYNTAIAISSLAAANDPSFKPAIDKAVAYLKSLQWTDTIQGGPKGEKNIDVNNPWYGGTGYGSHGRPDGSNTQLMVEALHDANLPKDDPAFQAALKFVTRMQNLSETNDQKWAGNDGGAIYTPANNGESMAGEYTSADGRRMLRSYGSMTYAMLKSYIYCGLSKDDPRVKAAWDWITRNWSLDENPGMRLNDPANAQYGLYYYYVTLARALHAYGEPTIVDPQGNKHDWRVELINKLASLQRPDGSFVGDKKWMEDSPDLATGFAALALEEALTDLKDRPAK